jgi:hypothetical protein
MQSELLDQWIVSPAGPPWSRGCRAMSRKNRELKSDGFNMHP